MPHAHRLITARHNPRTVNTRLTATAALLVLMSACSSAQPTFHLVTATVDATYQCPVGARDSPYTVHGSIVARNDTPSEVTIDSATAALVLTAVEGTWLEPVGSHYDAGAVDVSPKTVAPRSGGTLALSIPSSCTSGPSGSATTSSGVYAVTMRLVTSAGTFSIAAANKHEIRAT